MIAAARPATSTASQTAKTRSAAMTDVVVPAVLAQRVLIAELGARPVSHAHAKASSAGTTAVATLAAPVQTPVTFAQTAFACQVAVHQPTRQGVVGVRVKRAFAQWIHTVAILPGIHTA